jgi:hypothetical protein
VEYGGDVDGDNPSSAENQQERLKTTGWIVGFVDGEGCFSCSVYRCHKMTLGWFEKFVRIVHLMQLRRHLSVPGVIEIAEIIETMNHRKPSEALRILRDHTPALFADPPRRGRDGPIPAAT